MCVCVMIYIYIYIYIMILLRERKIKKGMSTLKVGTFVTDKLGGGHADTAAAAAAGGQGRS